MKRILAIITLISLNFVCAFINMSAQTFESKFHKLNSDLKKAIFVNDSTIIIIGTNSTILRSTDYGNNWSQIFPENRSEFNDIALCNNGVLITGNNGFMLNSTDEGLHWELLTKITDNNLYSIFSQDSVRIIATSSKMFLKSTDGGGTWVENTMNITASIKNFYIADEEHYYFVSGTGALYESNDGGSTWSRKYQPLSSQYLSSLFIKDKIFLLFQKSVYYSLDFGTNWREYVLDTPKNAIPVLLYEHKDKIELYYSGLFDFAIPYEMKILDDSTLTTEKNIYTTDSIYKIGNWNLQSVSFKNNYGVAVGNDKTIYITKDDGSNWQIRSYFNVQNIYDPSIQFFSDSLGFVSTYLNYIFRTSNGGATFVPQTNYSTYINDTSYIVDYVSSFKFINPNDGYTFLRNSRKLLSTKDGGKFYDSIGTYWYLTDYSNILCNKKDTFALSSYLDNYYYGQYPDKPRSYLNFSFDGGITFNTTIIDSSRIYGTLVNDSVYIFLCQKFKVYELYFDSAKGYTRLRSDATLFILKTSDYGKTWEYDTLDYALTKMNILSFYFFDKQTGFLSGYDSTYKCFLYKTPDGGKNWHQVYQLDDNILAVKFKNKSLGYATTTNANFNNYIIKSTDFGETWEKIQAEQPLMLKNIEFTQNKIFLVAYNELYFAFLDSTESSVRENEINRIESGAPPVWIFLPFPNPTKDAITFKILWDAGINIKDASLKICNINGDEVDDLSYILHQKTDNVNSTINYNTIKLPIGVYFAKIEYKGYMKVAGFIVDK